MVTKNNPELFLEVPVSREEKPIASTTGSAILEISKVTVLLAPTTHSPENPIGAKTSRGWYLECKLGPYAVHRAKTRYQKVVKGSNK